MKENHSVESQIEQFAKLIHMSKKIVVFTGAGVSTESGIPDFRSPDGIWTRFDPEDFTYQKFISSKEARKKMYGLFSESGLMADASPNNTHIAIAKLEEMGKLDCVITQNVDGLHQKAGNSDDKVFELHGNLVWVICLSCDKRYPIGDIIERVKQGEDDPGCEECRGILKPDAVFFGEALPQTELNNATDCSANCELFIVIGSSLVVYPAAYMPTYAVNAGAKLVLINKEPTHMDRAAHIRIFASAGDTMKKVMEKVKEKSIK
ncbi:MAG: NAD-dependent deacylase [Thermodesulfobacteriota bacterium]|nr:NAD-dependent deacylase [Thermodesulfobacteriota bacterium]